MIITQIRPGSAYEGQDEIFIELVDWLDTPIISVYNLAAVKIPR
jgi:hypothetical protein